MKNRVAEIRKKRKFTQNKLAQLTGLSRPYISDLENGKWDPKRKTMKVIADALNETVENIFYALL